MERIHSSQYTAYWPLLFAAFLEFEKKKKKKKKKKKGLVFVLRVILLSQSNIV